jgi:bifunctional DNase/RNase
MGSDQFMVRMTIEGVGFDQQRQTVVVLRDWEGEKLLPIWIGPNEARAIQIELEGAQTPRPMSHDLMFSIISVLNGRVTRVLINDIVDSTFYATIEVDTPKGTKSIDARPSDALALAVRAKCPIYVDGAVIEQLVEGDDTPKIGRDENQEELEQVVEEQQFIDENEEEVQRFKRLLGED